MTLRNMPGDPGIGLTMTVYSTSGRSRPGTTTAEAGLRVGRGSYTCREQPRMKSLSIALLVTVTALASACGGDEAPEPSTQDAASTTPQGVWGRAPAAVAGIPSVVFLRPSNGEQATPPSDTAVLDQLGLAFLPTQLLVRAGQTIEFVNSETLSHNVHVTSVANDSTVYLADMDPDDHRDLTLDTEGAYDVTCDVHPGMRALIYVTSAPYAAFAEMDGSYRIPNVPQGSYAAEVWSASPDLRTGRALQVTGNSTELDLTATP